MHLENCKNYPDRDDHKEVVQPIFYYEVCEGADVSQNIPESLEDAFANPNIRVVPSTGKPDAVCPIYLLPPEQQEAEALLSTINDEPETFHVMAQEVEQLVPVFSECTEESTSQPPILCQQNNALIMVGTSQPTTDIPEDNTEDVCNYNVVPLRRLVFIDKDGNEKKDLELFECEISISAYGRERFAVHTKDIRNLTKTIGNLFSAAVINHKVKKAEKIIERRFRSATVDVPVLRVYYEAGWQDIDNHIVYGFDGLHLSDDIIFQTGLTLPFYQVSDYEAGKIFFEAYDLYADKGPMSVMICFAFLGILYKPFDEAGHPVHFVLFLNGKTGSGKTTLGLLLFVQLADDHHRTTPRRIDTDTVTSFERGIISNGHDTVTLIDDYSPAKTPRQKNMMSEKLESIIRMVGDGSTKSRSNINLEDCRGEGVKGVVAVTGELTGKGLSSNLRCFYCGIQHDKVNFETVSRFQNYPYSVTTLIQKFSVFVADHWNDISNYIMTEFERQRSEIANYLEQRRLVDSTATLRITADIIGWFLQEKCGRPAEEVRVLVQEMQDNILHMGILSENLSSEDTPIVIAIRAIDQLILSNQVSLLQHKPDEQQLEEIDGFTDGDFVYFVPEKLFGKVKEYFSLTGMYLPLDLNEFARALCEEGVACSSSNGPNKRTYYARVLIEKGDRKRNFIKINLVALKQVVDQQ